MAAALQARTSVEAVEKSALPCFSDEAATLATFFGSPEKAVQACLAKIAGYEAGKPPDRSLLTNTENYVTCLYAAGLQIHSISYVWNFLRRSLPPDVCDAFKGMQLVADSDGAVFDVPAKHKAQLEGLDGVAVAELHEELRRPVLGGPRVRAARAPVPGPPAALVVVIAVPGRLS